MVIFHFLLLGVLFYLLQKHGLAFILCPWCSCCSVFVLRRDSFISRVICPVETVDLIVSFFICLIRFYYIVRYLPEIRRLNMDFMWMLSFCLYVWVCCNKVCGNASSVVLVKVSIYSANINPASHSLCWHADLCVPLRLCLCMCLWVSSGQSAQ